tara:strand:+ start:631 stop:2163 length:1533 start_codon:yes stop_codon:yes gene_type:complete
MNNIEDLPFDPSIQLNSVMMDKIIEYCDHDVNATELFYKECSKDIELRKQLSEVYDLDLTNANDPKIGSEIFLDLLSKEMKTNKWDLKKQRTYRRKIAFKDIIIDYIKYDTPEMNRVLNAFKAYQTGDGVKDFEISGTIGNIKNDFGQGGLHGCTKPGVYKSTQDKVIIDIDVASYYPNMAIGNKFRPQHLGESFSKIYESIYTLRKTFPKSDPRNTACKLMLNGSFGKMSDVYSFLYDPKALLSITVNGQLLLTMLMEKINSNVKGIEFLQSNTDGFTFLIDRDKVDYMKKIVTAWESKTNLVMEYAIYEKMIIRDVNNYMSITDTGKVKYKGCFEIDRDFHKNHSKRIVPIALANYYINGVNPVETIYNHFLEDDYSFCKNYGVFDFCLGSKMKGKNKLFARTINSNSVNDLQLGRVTRYYVSNDGVELIKKLPPSESNYLTETDKHPENQMNMFDIIEDVKVDPKDRETSIEAGWKSTVFNKYIDDDYDLNYSYYINEVNKIINKIN